jgi:hypothetical protein
MIAVSQSGLAPELPMVLLRISGQASRSRRGLLLIVQGEPLGRGRWND